MKATLFQPKRLQLNKIAARTVQNGHPWVFRGQMSTAVEVFRNGQWLRLVGTDNQILGYGILEKEGLIAVRVLKTGAPLPTGEWIRERLTKAILRREELRKYTDAFRALHGENDGFPGITVDVYGTHAVLQTYSPSVDVVGRWLLLNLRATLGLESATWKLPVKRRKHEQDPASEAAPARILFGNRPDVLRFREGAMQFAATPGQGQKTGSFLDLRGLRKWVSLQPLTGKRVLNLFSYTGMISLAAETAGANQVWSCDVSKGALAFAKEHHALDVSKHQYHAVDIFEWLPKLETKPFDLVVCDPPMVVARKEQIPVALKSYRKLFAAAAKQVGPKGKLVACCCSSRIERGVFRNLVAQTLGSEFQFEKSIGPEDDHPVGFAEGDYLKIFVFRRK